MTDKEAMEYAIHSNVLEGYVYTEEQIEFLMSIAEGKITVEEAIKIISEKQKVYMKDLYIQDNGTLKNKLNISGNEILQIKKDQFIKNI